MTVVYDPTASLTSNLIVGEIHTPITEPDIFTQQGPFFDKDFVVQGTVSGSSDIHTLLLFTDYIWSPLFSVRSADTGKEVYSYILLTDYSRWNTITLSYRAVGGDPDTVLATEIIAAGNFDRTNIINWEVFVGDVSALITSGVNYDFKNSSLASLFANKVNAIAIAMRTPKTFITFIETRFTALQNEVNALVAEIRSWNSSFVNNQVFSLTLLTPDWVANAISTAYGAITASLSAYVTHTGLTATLAAYETKAMLGSYVEDAVAAAIAALNTVSTTFITVNNLLATLANYVLTSALNTRLLDYVTNSQLATILAGYVQTSALAAYETTAALAATLTGYVTNSALASALSNLVTTSSLTTILSGYVTNSAMPIYVTNAINNAVSRASRIILTGDLVLYVSTTGTDNNNGLTSITPFLTRQKAWDTLVNNYDLSGYKVTIQFAGGTYSDTFNAVGSPLGLTDASKLVMRSSVAPTINTVNNYTYTYNWVAGTVYPTIICDHASVVLPDGRIMVIGGVVHSATDCLATIYFGTISSNNISWAMGTAYPITGGVFDHSATLLADGRVLVIGGSSSNYDLTNCYFGTVNGNNVSWVVGTSFLLTISTHEAVLLPDGRILVIGNNTYFGTINGNNISWALGTTLPVGASSYSLTLISPTRVLAIAPNGTSVTYFGTISGNNITWATGTNYPTSLTNHAAVLLPSGKIMVIGGDNRNTTYIGTINGTAISWTLDLQYPSIVSDHTADLLPDGRVIVIGGDLGVNDTNNINTVEFYTTNTVTNSVVTTVFTGMAVFSGTNKPAIAVNKAMFTLQNVLLQVSAGNNDALSILYNSEVVLDSGVVFNSIPGGSHISVGDGSVLLITKDYTINGNAISHYRVDAGGDIRVKPAVGVSSITVGLINTPIFSMAFAVVNRGHIEYCDFLQPAFTGIATGKRFLINNGGVITVNGAGTAYLPGSINGTYDIAPANFYG